MRQRYIQFNPPHRTSSLGFICSRLRLSKIPSFCCLLITRFRYYWRQIRNVSTNTDHMTSNSEDNAFDVSPAMVSHLTSYYRGCGLQFFRHWKWKDKGAVINRSWRWGGSHLYGVSLTFQNFCSNIFYEAFSFYMKFISKSRFSEIPD